ncbi:MAG TPA: cyclic nucleotide-binding domain-containing protein, partial [Myxococcota bacterium]|nr:cyclic nucleotide-binding domain-containing protein [Myxococcota bacterium]
MADSALDVFQAAEALLRAAKYPEALGAYLRVVRGVPAFWRARFRIADTLLNLKAPRPALEIYKALAWQAVKAGQPLQGLVAIKMATALDPSQREAIDIIAQLYNHGSDRVDIGLESLPRRLLKKGDEAGELGDLTGDALVATAAQEAADTQAMGALPAKLPPLPLFSFLDEDAFVAVLQSIGLKRFVQGNKIITEGQPGEAFYVLADGNVEVTRQAGTKTAQLARLGAGSVFGEMALISDAPRTATVTAMEDCEALELKRAALTEQAHKLASITQALKSFTHERFLTNLTATSPVFKPFPRSIRVEIVKKFRDFPVDAGDELITEGEAGQGLFLVMKGEV